MDGWINGEGGREEGKGKEGKKEKQRRKPFIHLGSWSDQRKLEKRDGIVT